MIGVQRENVGAISRAFYQLGVGIIGDLLRVECVDLGLSRRERGPWPKPRDDLQIVGMTVLDTTLFGIRGERQVEPGATGQIMEFGRQHAIFTTVQSRPYVIC